jgi:hypothetical protein
MTNNRSNGELGVKRRGLGDVEDGGPDSRVRMRTGSAGASVTVSGAVHPAHGPRDAATLREALTSDQLDFVVNTLHLRHLVGLELAHPFAGGARRLAAEHLAELEEIRDRLGDLLETRDPRLDRLLVPGSPLTMCVRGLLAFCEGVVAAFEEVLSRANDERIDWTRLRRQMLAAARSWPRGLVHSIRIELARDVAAGACDVALDAQLDALFLAAAELHERVAETGAFRPDPTHPPITERASERRGSRATRPPRSR